MLICLNHCRGISRPGRKASHSRCPSCCPGAVMREEVPVKSTLLASMRPLPSALSPLPGTVMREEVPVKSALLAGIRPCRHYFLSCSGAESREEVPVKSTLLAACLTSCLYIFRYNTNLLILR